jgi:hypothetical protein
VLEDKHIDDTMFSGRLLQLSDRAAELEVARALQPLSNIRIHVADAASQTNVVEQPATEYEIYAKVLGKEVDASGHAHIHFTSMPPEAKAWLHKIMSANS